MRRTEEVPLALPATGKKTYGLRKKAGGGIFQQARDRSFQRVPVRRRAEVG
jgi:hypothetical protein